MVRQLAKQHPLLCTCKKCSAWKFPHTHAAEQERKRKQRQQATSRPNRYHPNNRNWHPPVHGTTADGRPVTVSFGKDGSTAERNTGIADGHVSDSKYYGRDANGVKNHDHFGPNGESFGDRGRSTS